MSFGGQGFPNQVNTAQNIMDMQRAKMDPAMQMRDQQRAAEYAALRQPPVQQPMAAQGAMPQQRPPMNILPQQGQMMPPTGQPMPNQGIPQQQPQAMPQPRPQQDALMSAVQQAGNKMGQFAEANKAALGSVQPRPQEESKPQIGRNNSMLKRSLNDKLTSEIPEDFASAVEELGSMKDEDIHPDTPAFQLKQQAEQKWLKQVDPESGEKVYECPLTKKPCSRKTFWTRLKEFFLNLTGKGNPEQTMKTVQALDVQDPLTRAFDQASQQIKAQQPQASEAWNRPGQFNGFKGAM